MWWQRYLQIVWTPSFTFSTNNPQATDACARATFTYHQCTFCFFWWLVYQRHSHPLHKKWNFPLRISSLQQIWPNPQFHEDLITFTDDILNGKLNFLVQCVSSNCSQEYMSRYRPNRLNDWPIITLDMVRVSYPLRSSENFLQGYRTLLPLLLLCSEFFISKIDSITYITSTR